ncbi:hypothetical protein FH972_022839 [Carpinus fangiana]|uniref:Nitroreductase domain-containing protein n=1 Tax=Carpinus fangiana TaxID=176857 RepID=A0A5N6KTQ4_9ROSI|nr:hypothetical protein FH972_022839 [Carpinus fangiana]
MAPTNADAFLEAVAARRSMYAYTDKLPISDARVQEIVTQVLRNVPSAFNSQPVRAAVLLHDEHRKFWQTASDSLKGDEATLARPRGMIKAFTAGAGSVLFFNDRATLEASQKHSPAYAGLFPEWGQHSNGMHQYVLWTALEAEGAAASLQHFQFLGEEFVQKVRDQYGLPKEWELVAQLVIGGKDGDGGLREKAPAKDTSETIKVFGAKLHAQQLRRRLGVAAKEDIHQRRHAAHSRAGRVDVRRGTDIERIHRRQGIALRQRRPAVGRAILRSRQRRRRVLARQRHGRDSRGALDLELGARRGQRRREALGDGSARGVLRGGEIRGLRLERVDAVGAGVGAAVAGGGVEVERGVVVVEVHGPVVARVLEDERAAGEGGVGEREGWVAAEVQAALHVARTVGVVGLAVEDGDAQCPREVGGSRREPCVVGCHADVGEGAVGDDTLG